MPQDIGKDPVTGGHRGMFWKNALSYPLPFAITRIASLGPDLE
jgi:hypothetical protein